MSEDWLCLFVPLALTAPFAFCLATVVRDGSQYLSGSLYAVLSSGTAIILCFLTGSLLLSVSAGLAPVFLLAHARFLGAHRAPTAEARRGDAGYCPAAAAPREGDEAAAPPESAPPDALHLGMAFIGDVLETADRIGSCGISGACADSNGGKRNGRRRKRCRRRLRARALSGRGPNVIRSGCCPPSNPPRGPDRTDSIEIAFACFSLPPCWKIAVDFLSSFSVTKSEMVDGIAQSAGITKKAAAAALEALIEAITKDLKKGNNVVVTGFGTFRVSKCAPRTGVNPRNPSEKIKIPAMKVPVFKAGKALKEAIR